jgi:hypothetical protein
MAHFDLDSSDEAVQTMMDTYDTDHSGTIEFVEFMNMVMDSSFKKKDQAKMFSAVRTSSVLSACLPSHSHRARMHTLLSHTHTAFIALNTCDRSISNNYHIARHRHHTGHNENGGRN